MTSEDAATTPCIWHEGSVASAVDTANARGSLLLVCLVQDSVAGSESKRFEDRFAEPRVAAELSSLDIVPLKLVKDSADGLMFGQIFPIMVVPSLYLIRNGLLADFLNSTVDADQMLERIKKAADGHFQIPPPPSQSGAAPTPSPTPSASVQSAEFSTPSTPAAASAEASSPPTASEAGPSQRVEQQTIPTGASAGSTSNPKADQAKAAKQREISRRSSSKELTDAQRELAEKQNKKLKDKIEKEKREEAEYKKRVKQALEEDKARRKAEKERAQAATAAAKAQSAPAPEEVLTPSDIRAQNAGLAQARNDAAPALAFDSSRLNIRLFDGSSIRNTFKATDTLQDVRNWINENQEGDENAYNIVQLIPQRTFTDETKLLRDLELCPSATLVLKKTATSSSAYGAAGDGAVPTLMSYGWSAFSLAGKLASTAYSTAAYYNPLASSSPASGSGSGNGANTRSANGGQADATGSSKKKDRESSYNGNSTSLE
ncbi:hypothetical protein BGZ70_009273 [Mortierella alpina]|uniref:UBX domain-containing protein n=1 Tax=Mortierella alpina TaxID=64518 RepID=A0A9P6JCY2_MORAP|nr:hypothetical protein BGZ70_009273 [Mortierella alpina]